MYVLCVLNHFVILDRELLYNLFRAVEQLRGSQVPYAPVKQNQKYLCEYKSVPLPVPTVLLYYLPLTVFVQCRILFLNFLICYPTIERNKKLVTQVTQQIIKLGGGAGFPR